MNLREIDRAVAINVFGMIPCKDPKGRCDAVKMNPPQCYQSPNDPHGSALKSYSSNITDAWEVLEKWHGDFDLKRQNKTAWRCAFYIPSYEYEVWEKTAPLAICKAALKTVEVEV